MAAMLPGVAKLAAAGLSRSPAAVLVEVFGSADAFWSAAVWEQLLRRSALGLGLWLAYQSALQWELESRLARPSAYLRVQGQRCSLMSVPVMVLEYHLRPIH